jgi:NCAIR mutase (PurE)-related protein
MTADELRELLDGVRTGTVGVGDAAARIGGGSVAELGYATLDLDRRQRCGFAEVVFAEGKTAEWVEGAVRRLSGAGEDCFVTRVSADQAAHLAAAFPHADQDRLARTFWLPAAGERPAPAGRVVVVTAGTSDLPVAQEALVTARVMGAAVDLVVDVGVAGLHRILRQRTW